ncbi:hypothetical protein [Luteolibacter sp. LG18]|uniref:hypothetical protein n=1 Tax=Luteolibacter sp. LG18 TaxID=2819286 RepID=UPI002B27FC05|nr:hypothetical protein llg_11110 [Luteolibacter sp. LG18]
MITSEQLRERFGRFLPPDGSVPSIPEFLASLAANGVVVSDSSAIRYIRKMFPKEQWRRPGRPPANAEFKQVTPSELRAILNKTFRSQAKASASYPHLREMVSQLEAMGYATSKSSVQRAWAQICDGNWMERRKPGRPRKTGLPANQETGVQIHSKFLRSESGPSLVTKSDFGLGPDARRELGESGLLEFLQNRKYLIRPGDRDHRPKLRSFLEGALPCVVYHNRDVSPKEEVGSASVLPWTKPFLPETARLVWRVSGVSWGDGLKALLLARTLGWTEGFWQIEAPLISNHFLVVPAPDLAQQKKITFRTWPKSPEKLVEELWSRASFHNGPDPYGIVLCPPSSVKNFERLLNPSATKYLKRTKKALQIQTTSNARVFEQIVSCIFAQGGPVGRLFENETKDGPFVWFDERAT